MFGIANRNQCNGNDHRQWMLNNIGSKGCIFHDVPHTHIAYQREIIRNEVKNESENQLNMTYNQGKERNPEIFSVEFLIAEVFNKCVKCSKD